MDQASIYRSGIYRAIAPALLGGFARVHVLIYRALGGRLVDRISIMRDGRGHFMPLLLLTTVGRRTGQTRVRPVGYIPDGDDFMIVGTNGGLRANPAWLANLRADPRAEIQVRRETIRVRASILADEERERAWARVVSKYPYFAVYQRGTPRQIPVVRLRRSAEALAGRAGVA